MFEIVRAVFPDGLKDVLDLHHEHPPVTNNPVPGTHFMGLNLELYNQALQRPSL